MHLNSEAVLDLIEGRTASTEMKALSEHIDRCSSCSRQLQEFRRMHSLLQDPRLESAPVEFLDRARAIFDPRPDVKQPTIREIAAAVVFDSLTQPAFAGVRGETDARHVVLRAEELDIHLKISTNPSRQQIIGQVFARNETQFLSSVRLHLLLDGMPFKSTWSDNFGEFQFDEVPQGVFRLQVDLPHLTVVGGICIGERA